MCDIKLYHSSIISCHHGTVHKVWRSYLEALQTLWCLLVEQWPSKRLKVLLYRIYVGLFRIRGMHKPLAKLLKEPCQQYIMYIYKC